MTRFICKILESTQDPDGFTIRHTTRVVITYLLTDLPQIGMILEKALRTGNIRVNREALDAIGMMGSVSDEQTIQFCQLL